MLQHGITAFLLDSSIVWQEQEALIVLLFRPWLLWPHSLESFMLWKQLRYNQITFWQFDTIPVMFIPVFVVWWAFADSDTPERDMNAGFVVVSCCHAVVLCFQCLVTCGKGYKHRQTWCQFGEDRLDDRLCDSSSKPVSMQTCQQQECAAWQVGPWGQVSLKCPCLLPCKGVLKFSHVYKHIYTKAIIYIYKGRFNQAGFLINKMF